MTRTVNGTGFPVEAPCVALVGSVFADAGDDALDRAPFLSIQERKNYIRFFSLYDVLDI